MKYILNNDSLEVVGKQYLNGVGNYTGDTTNASDLATVINDKADKTDIVTPDWNAEPNEKGYIDNRTHYSRNIILASNESNGKHTYYLDFYEFEDTTTAWLSFYDITESRTREISLSELNDFVLGLGYAQITFSLMYDSNEGAYYVVVESSDGTVDSRIVNSITIQAVDMPLNQGFIPDTIARTSQIPTTLPADGGHADSSYMANRLDCPDTRNEQIVPNDTSKGLWTDFKQKNVTGLSAEYSGVISYRPYSQAGDWTGGPMHNLAFDENGIHHRKSNSDGTGWHGWRHIPYRDEVENCPEYHDTVDDLNIEGCQLYDPSTGEYMGSYYGTHELPDVIFDYKYVGGNFENAPNSYGGMLTFPWQRAKGNTGPNYASQLFIPHGDEEDTAIKFRTSQSEEWNSWRTVIDNENYTEYAAKHDHKHNVTAAGNVSLSGSVDSNGILTISATFTGTQVKASTPTT